MLTSCRPPGSLTPMARVPARHAAPAHTGSAAGVR